MTGAANISTTIFHKEMKRFNIFIHGVGLHGERVRPSWEGESIGFIGSRPPEDALKGWQPWLYFLHASAITSTQQAECRRFTPKTTTGKIIWYY